MSKLIAMGCNTIVIIFLIYCFLLLSFPFSQCISITSEQKSIDVEMMGPSPVKISSASSSRQANVEEHSGDLPLAIVKRLLNQKDGKFFANQPIWVVVDISGLEKVENLYITESADSDLLIVNYSAPLITTKPIEITNPEKVLKFNSLYNNSYNLITNELRDGLDSGEHLIYAYCMMPMNEGFFNTYTFAKTYDRMNQRREKCMISQFEIIEAKPEFLIFMDTKKLEANSNEPIPLKFSVKYMGGTPTSSYTCNATLDNSSEYILDNSLFNATFDESNLTLIYANVRYRNKGIYSLPGISVGGQYMASNQYVTIHDPLSNYLNQTTIAALSALIALISVFLTKRESNKSAKLQSQIDDMKLKIQKLP